MIDSITKEVYIIDWGLADFYIPNQSLNCRVSTRSYKSPELLINNKVCTLFILLNQYYDYSMDMWAFGCMIAGIAFNKFPFFKAHGNINQLLSIVDVLGTEGLYDYAKKYKLTIPPEAEKEMGIKRRRDWTEFASEGIQKFLCTEFYDLLDNLLIYDHQVE